MAMEAFLSPDNAGEEGVSWDGIRVDIKSCQFFRDISSARSVYPYQYVSIDSLLSQSLTNPGQEMEGSVSQEIEHG
jgi:hypothetical protein